MNAPPGPDKVVATNRPPVTLRSRWFTARNEVAWLFVLAAVIRAVAAWATPTILPDSVTLLHSAARFDRDGLAAALSIHDHPLTPWLLSLVPRRLDLETVATALCVLAGAAAVWPLHVLARRACGRHAATACCIVYAALPKAVGVASIPSTSAVLLPLFASGLSLATAAGLPSSKSRRLLRLATAGAACGLAYLCRPEGLAVAAAAIGATLIVARRGRRLASAAVVAAAFALVAAPYAISLSMDAGQIALSPKKDVVKVVGAAETPLRTSTGAAVAATSETLQNTLTAPVLLLVLVGVFLPRRWRHRGAAKARMTLLALAGVMIGLVVRVKVGWGYQSARHLLPAVLLLLPFAGEGFLFVGAFISRVVARRRLAVVLASFFAIPCAVNAVMRPVGEYHADERHLGEAVASTVTAPDADAVGVASFEGALVAYYADRTLRASRHGGARDVPLLGRFGRLIDDSAHLDADESAALRAALAATLRRDGARWLVLDLFPRKYARQTTSPQKRLARALVDDGVLDEHVVAAGGSLAAFPVK